MNVHYFSPPEKELPRMQAALHPDIRLTTGKEMPDDAHIIIAGRATPEQLAAPNLRAVIVPWAGLPSGLRAQMPDYPHLALHNLHHNAIPTAETALALLLAAAKRLTYFDSALRRADWTPRYERPSPSMLLHGKTALILGYGAIGQHIAAVCRALGMRVLATKRTPPPTAPDGIELHAATDLHTLLPQANAVIIALPLTPETEGLLGEDELALLPPGALLVNIGRGPIVDEQALYDALTNGRLGAAGLDVWYNYPEDEASRTHTPPANVPLHELDNVILSPHRGGMTADTDRLRVDALVAMLNTAVSGRPLPNKISLDQGY